METEVATQEAQIDTEQEVTTMESGASEEQVADTVPPPTAPAARADDEVSTLRALTRSAIEREQRLQAELDALRMAQQPSNQVAEPTEEEFAANPFQTLKKLIAAQQAPIQDFVKQQQRVTNFNTEFQKYVERTPALAPYADQIRGQLAQNFLASDMPINQSVIDVHTKALIGNMVMQSALQPPTTPAAQPSASAPVVPPTPPKPRPASTPADPVKLTESQLRTKKSIDPDGKIWPDNKSFLEYLNAEERVIPL